MALIRKSTLLLTSDIYYIDIKSSSRKIKLKFKSSTSSSLAGLLNSKLSAARQGNDKRNGARPSYFEVILVQFSRPRARSASSRFVARSKNTYYRIPRRVVQRKKQI